MATESCLDVEDIARQFSDTSCARTFSPQEVEEIRGRLLAWYHDNRRKLPWRGDAIDGVCTAPQMTAYGTWVSEIMCQQTRVDTVISYWLRWMEAIPTVQALATASIEDINSLWSGLGYYRRAKMLQLGAQYVCDHHNGEVPLTVDELLKIPGIGPYTAGAIASLAGNVRAPVVDGNVIRVLSRLKIITHDVKSTKMQKLCWELADALVDPVDPGAFNQAVMELGAIVCKPMNPACEDCPIRSFCYARALADRTAELESQPNLPKDVTYFPIKTPKKDIRQEIYRVHVIERRLEVGAKYLFIKRPARGLLAGQWELPSCLLWPQAETSFTPDHDDKTVLPDLDSLPEADMAREFFQVLKLRFHEAGNEDLKDEMDVYTLQRSSVTQHDVIEHIFSHVKHYMHVSHHVIFEPTTGLEGWESCEGRQLQWMTMEELAQVGITTGVKKVLQAVQGTGKKKAKRKGPASSKHQPSVDSAESTVDKKQRKLTSFF